MNRPDKLWNKLSVAEKEVGGIPNSSEDIKQAHAAAIETYIRRCGLQEDWSLWRYVLSKNIRRLGWI